MYRIDVDDLTIFDDTISFVDHGLDVIDPVLNLEESAAGSLEITIPKSNVGFDKIERMTSTFYVYKNDQVIWSGRAVNETEDFFGNKAFTVEGALAFLNDTIQPQNEFHNMTVIGFWEHLISVHNDKSERKFKIGAITVTDPNDSLYRFTDYETTIDAINEKLIEPLGGYVRVRYVGKTPYIDHLKDPPKTSAQQIKFGENLLDFTKNWDMTDFCTVVLPLGKEIQEETDTGYGEDGNPVYPEETEYEQLPNYLTVKSVNAGSIYVPNLDTVRKYGWIERKVQWNDVTTPEYLLKVAKEYLLNIQFDYMEIELSAVDLHYFDVNYESIDLLDNVRTISEPHGLDRTFPVKKMKIPLNKPESTKFTLGDKATTSLTSINTAINQDVYDRINRIPSYSGILKRAQNNATALINMAGKSGNVVLRNNEILIMDEPDIDRAQNIWRWNVNGFGHSSNGYAGPFNTAITMDGVVMGECIEAGSISAEKLSVEATKTMEKLATDYVDGQLSKYYTAVTIDSKLSTLADSIILEVTSRTIPNENLLVNTRNPQDTAGLVATPDHAPMLNSYTRENMFVSAVSSGTTLGTFNYTSRFPVTAGKAYTFSADALTYISSGNIRILFCWSKSNAPTDEDAYDGSLLLNVPVSGAGSRKDIAATFTAPDKSKSAYIRYYAVADTAPSYSTNCYFNKLKMEVGNAATPWEMNKTDIVSRATLKVTDDKITSKVSTSEFGTYVEQNSKSVRIAWNNVSSYVSIESGGVVVYRDGGKIENNITAKLSYHGLELWRTGTNVGSIGTNEFDSDSSKKGLVFDLNYWGYYMCWGAQSSEDSNYFVKLIYAHGSFNDYIEGHLYFSAPTHAADIFVIENNTYAKENGSYYKGVNGSSTVYIPCSPPSNGEYYEAQLISGLVVNTYSNDNEVTSAR